MVNIERLVMTIIRDDQADTYKVLNNKSLEYLRQYLEIVIIKSSTNYFADLIVLREYLLNNINKKII